MVSKSSFMPRGGARPGAGRPRGSATAPVRKALRAAVRARLIEPVERSGDPLTLLCDVVRDRSIDLATRIYAAEVLLPYVAPRQNGLPPHIDTSAHRPVQTLDIPA